LATLEFDEQKNILFYRVHQDQVVEEAEIKEMLGYVEEFVGYKNHYAVVDFGGNLTSSPEARGLYETSDYINTYRLADAFLVRSLAVRIVANFFIKVTKPKVNTKLFTDEKEAVKWLEGLAKSEKKNGTI
ncbi:MAG TPA: hypothetical protein PLC65_14920, partial [Bacteroidia bacterium]|nr:hypothetical protein [Bacteroidia bacterium]